MVNKLIQFVKIGGVITLAYLISALLVHEIFLGGPQVRPDLNIYLAKRLNPSTYTNLISSLFNKKSSDKGSIIVDNKETIEQGYKKLEEIAFKNISTGVKARERDNISETTYELDKIKWVEYKYARKNGEIITIRVPEGQTPPPDGIL